MGFDEVYEESRHELYVALALATGSRDVAADTVDEAFRGWHARVWRKRLPKPEKAAVMSVALRRIARMTRNGADVPQGFRLRTAPLDEGHRRTLREFRSLPLAPRMGIVLSRRLGWDDEVVAAATGIDEARLEAEFDDALSRLSAALGVDGTDTATLLDHALDAEAEGLREPISRASGMRTAGLTARILRATGGVAVVLLAGLGITAGVAAIDFGSDTPGTTVASPAGSTAPTTVTVATGPPTLEEVAFTWAAASVPIARNNGDVRSISATGDEIVLVGMEYGQRSQPVIARSKDGLDWELLGSPFVGDGDLVGAAAADGLYAVAGNRWNGVGSNVSLWLSTDGFDWVEVPVPLEDRAPFGDFEVQVYNWVQRVDIIGDELMMVVQSNAELDERALNAILPGGIGNGGWGTSMEGIQVFDERGQARFFTWDDLGLSDEQRALIAPGVRVLTSADRGETWTTESLPGSGQIMSVGAGSDLAGVVVTDLFGPELWVRRAGEWTMSDIDLAVNAVAAHAGALYVVGERPGGSVEVWRSGDGSDWESVLGGVENGQYQLSAGPAGLATWSVGGAGFARPVETEVAGYRVEVYQMGGIRVYDGEELVAEFSQERIWMQGASYEVTDAEGNVLFQLTQRDLEQVFMEREGDFAGPFDADLRLYVTPNGLNWQRVTVDGELPESFYAFAGAPVGDGVALLGWDQRGEGQQLWIGSPAV